MTIINFFMIIGMDDGTVGVQESSDMCISSDDDGIKQKMKATRNLNMNIAKLNQMH